MSHQSAARAARRECKRRGHVPKTGGDGDQMCARCLIALDAFPEQDGQR